MPECAGDLTADEDLWVHPDAQPVLSGYAILELILVGSGVSNCLLLCLASWVSTLKRCVCVMGVGMGVGEWGGSRGGLSRSRAHY